MASYDRQIEKLLKDAGCQFERPGKGSHSIWRNPATNQTFAVSHDVKTKGTANKILKDAGLPKAF
ncbi:type II toxin-antitoxin system HicA family toxin [Rhodovarius crocodyli]|uniref:Type II toxin-antitoxin system HicA family toxin n=1 Tax=Rhodovarius crocodyli TaxID=1979269 RepID=A0A437MF07_9PROT|nr:type II toxin-antitoxin system HicA family toxin [Rhodovarius crocodyli]RVT96250.1 type II toxin-antitoxin system HicA family toxin [Rhodovarius crocodyli]